MALRTAPAFLTAALVCVCAASMGCGRKSSKPNMPSASPDKTAYTSYAGAWKGYLTKTAETAECKTETDGTMLGPDVVTVSSAGVFSNATGDYSGLISEKGVVKGTFTDGVTCGEGPWTGTCWSHAMCSGTYVTYGITQDRVVQGESGTWIMTR